jgi:hypothetical protein
MDKNIRTYNNKGDLHGYQERYRFDIYRNQIKSSLLVRTNMCNGKIITYFEHHRNDKQTRFYIR